MTTLQSGSQSSGNRTSVEFSNFPVDQAATIASPEPDAGLENTAGPPAFTPPSRGPLPLELHIEEDGCSPPTSATPTALVTSSGDFQHSDSHRVGDGGSPVSGVSHGRSFSVSDAVKPPSQSSAVDGGRRFLPERLRAARSPTSASPRPELGVLEPVAAAKSPGQAGFECASPPPGPETDGPVPLSPSPELRSTGPITAPRHSGPIPGRASPVPVPVVLGSVTTPAGASPAPKSVSPAPSWTPSPVSGPNVSNPAFEPKDSTPERPRKNGGPVQQPRLSGPVSVPRGEPAVESAALDGRQTCTFPGIGGAAWASPVPPAVVQPNSPTCPPSRDITDLTWRPLSARASDGLLSPDAAHFRETQPPVCVDDGGAWQEEDGFYPDFSGEGTLTPTTESSWMEESFTPSTCPGTPDATLHLATQQPSAAERLSASGQVGQWRRLPRNKLRAQRWRLLQPLWPFQYGSISLKYDPPLTACVIWSTSDYRSKLSLGERPVSVHTDVSKSTMPLTRTVLSGLLCVACGVFASAVA